MKTSRSQTNRSQRLRKNRLFRTLLKQCLNLKTNHRFFIVTDTEFQPFSEELWQRAREFVPGSFLIKAAGNGKDRRHFSASLREILSAADVALLAGNSLSLTPGELNKLEQQRVKLARLNCSDFELLGRVVAADYEKMNKLSRRLADVFSIGRQLEITHSNGSRLTMRIDSSKGVAEDGCLAKEKPLATIPGGMANVRPRAKSASGALILEEIGVVSGIGLIREPVRLFFKEGQLSRIEGRESAIRLRKALRTAKIPKRELAFVGVGTNRQARLSGKAIEDERALGAIHLAIGQQPIRLDSPFLQPYLLISLSRATLSIDNHVVVEKGNICV